MNANKDTHDGISKLNKVTKGDDPSKEIIIPWFESESKWEQKWDGFKWRLNMVSIYFLVFQPSVNSIWNYKMLHVRQACVWCFKVDLTRSK